MAYERKQQVIAPGGLNLLASGDLISGTDSIAMKNFRADGSGVLRSKLNASPLSPLISLTGYVHTIYRTGNDRWFGAGNDLYRNGVLFASGGYDGEKLGMTTANGQVFIMNRGWQIIVTAAGTGDDWIPQPPAVPALTPLSSGTGGMFEGGTWRYRVTYVRRNGECESNPSSEASITLTTGQDAVNVVCPAPPAGAGITHWNLWRIGNTVGTWYRVNQDPIAIGTTSFDDSATGQWTDEEITRFGMMLEFDHDQPPEARCLVGPYYGRLIAAGSAEHPNRIWWTPVNQPYYWPAENYVDLGDANDEIVALRQHDKQIRVYMKRAIGRLSGDPGNGGSAGIVFRGIGLIGQNGVDSWGETDYFVGQEGIYRNNGDIPEPVSAKIEPLFRPLTITPGADPDLHKLSQAGADRSKNWIAIKNGRLYFGYVDAAHAGQMPNQMLVANLQTGDWWAENAPGGAGYHCLYYEGQGWELIGANSLGVIYYLETEPPAANTVPLRWTSGWWAGWPRERTGRIADLVVEHSVKRGAGTGRDLTAKVKIDNEDAADVSAGVIPVATAAAGAERLVSVFPLGTDGRGVHARNAAVLIEGDTEHETSVYSVTLHFHVEPRDAKTFDSRATDCGDPRWKQFDLLDLNIYNRGTVTWDIQTGPPGGQVSSTATGTIDAVSDRTPVPVAVEDCEGVLVQVVLTSPEIFWLYSARLRYRAIPLYLAGNNKVWKGPVKALGV